MFIQEQKKLPRDATPQERAEATRRAAKLYRGEGASGGARRREARNPRLRLPKLNLVSLGLLGAAGYYGYNWWKNRSTGV